MARNSDASPLVGSQCLGCAGPGAGDLVRAAWCKASVSAPGLTRLTVAGQSQGSGSNVRGGSDGEDNDSQRCGHRAKEGGRGEGAQWEKRLLHI